MVFMRAAVQDELGLRNSWASLASSPQAVCTSLGLLEEGQFFLRMLGEGGEKRACIRDRCVGKGLLRLCHIHDWGDKMSH